MMGDVGVVAARAGCSHLFVRVIVAIVVAAVQTVALALAGRQVLAALLVVVGHGAQLFKVAILVLVVAQTAVQITNARCSVG